MIDFLTENLSKLFFWPRREEYSDLILTPAEALAELERRRQDPQLKQRIEEYLGGDIPEYCTDGPILHISRYIVTPNFETLRFIHLIKHLGHRLVASQDSKGLFVSQNIVKRALCKLPVCRRLSQKNGIVNEQYENLSVVDFNSADGKRFCDIKTLWGEPLIDFHTRLFAELNVERVETFDDAEWIDRHHRDDLLEQYKNLLALFVVHGIFFENYDMDDPHEVRLMRHIIRPACEFVEKKFGHRPLMVHIFPTVGESSRFWISYPAKVADVVEKSMYNPHLHNADIPVPFTV